MESSQLRTIVKPLKIPEISKYDFLGVLDSKIEQK